MTDRDVKNIWEPGSMTDRERIERLERMVHDLAAALARQGTIQDGNWGYPSSHHVFKRIENDMGMAV